MADYDIPFTDQANKGNITVTEGSFNNTDTSLTFPGRLVSDYGEFVNTNFLQLLENFANVNPPANPVEGQLWYDTTENIDQLKIYDGTNWVSAGGLKKGANEPAVSNSVVGDIWVDTTNSQLYVFSGSGWVLVGPNFSSGVKTGALPETIIDTSDVERTVVKFYALDGNGTSTIVAIVSAYEFQPKQTLAGFSRIKIGYNPNTNLTNNKFNGTADIAENLLINNASIPASDVMRNNIINQLTESLRIRNNNGIEIGTTKTISMLVEGTSGIIEHSLTGSNLDFRVNNNGVFTTAIRVKSDLSIGINDLNPDEKLSVIGNIRISAPTDTPSEGNLIVGGTTNSTSPTTGSLKTAGGLGVAEDVYIGGNLVVQGTDPANVTTITAGSIEPDALGRYLGKSTNAYDQVHAGRFYGNLSGDVTGNVSGAAGSAAKLNSLSTFTISGDITSSGFTFDGQTGGSTKTFATTLSQDFVDTKTTLLSIDNATDKILISRAGALYNATPSLIVDNIPTIPVGSVIMYGGFAAPSGWAICNGQEFAFGGDYQPLADALGIIEGNVATYYWGTPGTSGNFKVPDFRGRFALGLDFGGPSTGSNRMQQAAAQQMGGLAGSQKKTIQEVHLPEHTHDLSSSTGEQFYATTTATATAPEVTSSNGDTAGTGTRLDNSGGMTNLTNEEFDVSNPFAAINFIIYHGVT